jgi:uncharacterized caspase-like protein
LAVVICWALAGSITVPAQDVYDNLSALDQLKKALNDARAMATSLRDLGFEATPKRPSPTSRRRLASA